MSDDNGLLAGHPESRSWRADLTIRRWTELGDRERRLVEIDAIFFEASGTKAFESDAEREAFRGRWLGRYIEYDAPWFYVAMAGPPGDGGLVAGYLAGSLDDPARTPRFDDIGYFRELAPLTALFPAHLHINLAPQYRSRGWGERLIAAFAADARAAGAPGMHVVTGRGLRNVRFYSACGFAEVGSFIWHDRELVMLGRAL